MIQIIGVIIGLYVVTRMIELVSGQQKAFVKGTAILTMLASFIGIVLLLVGNGPASLVDNGPLSAGIDHPHPVFSFSHSSVDRPETPPESDGWQVSETKDPMDDSPTVVLRLESVDGMTRMGKRPTLLLRCTGHKTDVYVNWDEFMGSESAQVTSRLGRSPAQSRDWLLSTDSQATFYPGQPVPFIRSLMAVDTLVLQTTPYNESPITAVFVVKGLAGRVGALQTACAWK